MSENLVIGLDYGTDSVRAVLVDADNGAEISTSSAAYPRWAAGDYCEPAENRFRQHPLDYLSCLEEVVAGALTAAPPGAGAAIRGISIDTTGSTPIAVDEQGTALSLKPEFSDNPNAMFVLWKDHTAVREADEINALARSWGGQDFTRFEGGIYSSEWFWAKVLHVLRADAAVAEAAFSWVEHCDWLPAVLTGNSDPLTLKRGRCSAGHKAMWHASWGGLPPEAFLIRLDPLLSGLRARLYTETFTADTVAGRLTEDWAEKLGLQAGIPVGVGAFDAHVGAVGAGVRPGVLTKIMGTSTCDIAVATPAELGDRLIRGICGQVDGSVLPGVIGLEAGQSAFGDVYAWFKDMINGPARQIIASSTALSDQARAELLCELDNRTLIELEAAAVKLPLGAGGITALDWINGRRTPDANQNLKLAMTGLSMGSDAARIYRALVEATAFGSRCINERLAAEGVKLDRVVALGGIAKKSSFVLQVCADVLNCPITVVDSDECCALGAAMFAATIGGVYSSIAAAQAAMVPGTSRRFDPIPEHVAAYDVLYQQYLTLARFAEGEGGTSA